MDPIELVEMYDPVMREVISADDKGRPISRLVVKCYVEIDEMHKINKILDAHYNTAARRVSRPRDGARKGPPRPPPRRLQLNYISAVPQN